MGFPRLGMVAGAAEVADFAVLDVSRAHQAKWLPERTNERPDLERSTLRVCASKEPGHGSEASSRAGVAVPGRANIWLGTAEDVGFGFELAHWTNSTDPNVDSERAKVVNDLVFTGCVGATELLSGDPMDLKDPKAEHSIVTDGDVAAVRLTDCLHPRLMAVKGNTPGLHTHGKGGAQDDRIPR